MSTVKSAGPRPHGQVDAGQGQVIDRRHMMVRLGLLAAAAAASQTGPAASPAVAQTATDSSLASTASCLNTGTIWWSELICPNPERVRDFYAQVVGWQNKVVALDDPTRPPNSGEAEYTIFTTNGREGAGLVRTDASEPAQSRSGWLTYIQVANVDTSAETAANKGGKVIKPPFDIPGVGRIAVIEDPQGAVVGLVTPLSAESC